MNPERWLEVKNLFYAALERPPGERPAFLDSAGAGDDELRAEARALLRAHDCAGDFIESSAFVEAGVAAPDDDASAWARSLRSARL